MLHNVLRAAKTRGTPHPGRLFVETKGVPRGPGEMLAYVEHFVAFLREHTGVAGAQTAQLATILDYFGTDVKRGRLGPRQRGLIVRGLNAIVVNEADLPVRQRFTLAHELVEMLIDSVMERELPPGVSAACSGPAKERLCEAGAGMLLMPHEQVSRIVGEERPTLQMASRLADHYAVSLTAALIRLVRLARTPTRLTVWSQDPKGDAGSQQAGVLNGATARPLRLAWHVPSPREKNVYFPFTVEAPARGAVGRAFVEKSVQQGRDEFRDGCSQSWWYDVEARRVLLNRHQGVFALLTRVTDLNQLSLW